MIFNTVYRVMICISILYQYYININVRRTIKLNSTSESQEEGVRKDQKLSVMMYGRNAFGV